MSLKLYRVDIPTVMVNSFLTLAESEAEALALIGSACSGDLDARKRVDIVESHPLIISSQKQIRAAEPGTADEKQLRRERIYPTFAMIQVECVDDEN